MAAVLLASFRNAMKRCFPGPMNRYRHHAVKANVFTARDHNNITVLDFDRKFRQPNINKAR